MPPRLTPAAPAAVPARSVSLTLIGRRKGRRRCRPPRRQRRRQPPPCPGPVRLQAGLGCPRNWNARAKQATVRSPRALGACDHTRTLRKGGRGAGRAHKAGGSGKFPTRRRGPACCRCLEAGPAHNPHSAGSLSCTAAAACRRGAAVPAQCHHCRRQPGQRAPQGAHIGEGPQPPAAASECDPEGRRQRLRPQVLRPSATAMACCSHARPSGLQSMRSDVTLSSVARASLCLRACLPAYPAV